MAKKAEKKAAPAKKAGKEKPAAKVSKAAVKPVKATKPAKATERVEPKKLEKAVKTPKVDKPVLSLVENSPEVAPVEKPVKVKAPKLSKAAKAEMVAASEEQARWIELHEKYKAEKAQAYDMKGTFETGKPLQHKLLGWGWILSNENDRLEVLFRDGKKMLISNYNPNR